MTCARQGKIDGKEKISVLEKNIQTKTCCQHWDGLIPKAAHSTSVSAFHQIPQMPWSAGRQQGRQSHPQPGELPWGWELGLDMWAQPKDWEKGWVVGPNRKRENAVQVQLGVTDGQGTAGLSWEGTCAQTPSAEREEHRPSKCWQFGSHSCL